MKTYLPYLLLAVLATAGGSIPGAVAQCTAVISTFPYSEDFESGSAGWISGGINNDWTLGIPSKAVINTAASGDKCWITGGLTGSFYSLGERSFVESPCFDFSSLDFPIVTFSVFWETEFLYDGGNLQYSLDGGATWTNVGTFQDDEDCFTKNWFNQGSVNNLAGLATVKHGWSGNISQTTGSCLGGNGSGEWVQAGHCLKDLAHEPQVIFRFTFGSGTTCNNFDGFAFDIFRIENAVSPAAAFNYTCLSVNQVSFVDASGNCPETWQWSFGDGGTDNQQNSAHVYSAPGTYQVRLIASNNCSEPDTVVLPVTIVDAGITSTETNCSGDSSGSATAVVNTPGTFSFSWNTVPSQSSQGVSNLPAGSYTVVITGTEACPVTLTTVVQESSNGIPEVFIGNDTTICSGQFITLNAGEFASYMWNDGSDSSLLGIMVPGVYWVRVATDSGCVNADTIAVEESCLDDIAVPNSFTPNGDGVNETFGAFGIGIRQFNLKIFNRWGELVFEGASTDEFWDGTYSKHHMQEEVFVWVATYSTDGVNMRTKRGRVTLLH